MSEFGFAVLWAGIVGVPVGLDLLLPRTGGRRLGSEGAAALNRWRRRIDYLFVPLALPVGVAIGVVVWYACGQARVYTLTAAPNAVTFPPLEDFHGRVLWGAPAMVMGLVGWGVGHALFVRLFLNAERRQQYKAAVILRNGRHRLLLGRLTVAWVVPLTLIAVLLTLDCYFRIEPDKVVVNEFLGFGEKSYNTTDVLAVVETSHVYTYSVGRSPQRRLSEKERESRRLWVFFKDGTEWVITKQNQVEFVKAELERRTGRPAIRMRHIQDVSADELQPL